MCVYFIWKIGNICFLALKLCAVIDSKNKKFFICCFYDVKNNIAGLESFSLNVKFGKYILHEFTHVLHVTSLASKHWKYGDAMKFMGYITQLQSAQSIDFSKRSSHTAMKVTAQIIQ